MKSYLSVTLYKTRINMLYPDTIQSIIIACGALTLPNASNTGVYMRHRSAICPIQNSIAQTIRSMPST